VTDAPRQLDYAPPVAWHHRRSLHRWLILLACLATLASSYWWGPPAWQHAQILYWQRQCMNYSADPDEVVWFDGADQVSILVAWSRFRQHASINAISAGTVFLHARRNPQGVQRLVAVDLIPIPGSFERPDAIMLRQRVIQPGNILQAPADHSIRRERRAYAYRSEFVILAGQPDPDDPTHFTIECFIDGERTIIDGWLQDDDTVLLERRPAWAGPSDDGDVPPPEARERDDHP
jgi:hypothetical protein